MARKIIKKGNRLVEVEAGKPENLETAIKEAPERAVKPVAKHIGGGWYLTADGRKVRKSQLEAGD